MLLFRHSAKLSGYRTGTKFHDDHLTLEQNNYLTKMLGVYIVNDLHA